MLGKSLQPSLDSTIGRFSTETSMSIGVPGTPRRTSILATLLNHFHRLRSNRVYMRPRMKRHTDLSISLDSPIGTVPPKPSFFFPGCNVPTGICSPDQGMHSETKRTMHTTVESSSVWDCILPFPSGIVHLYTFFALILRRPIDRGLLLLSGPIDFLAGTCSIKSCSVVALLSNLVRSEPSKWSKNLSANSRG